VTHHGPSERAQQREKGTQQRSEAALQSARRADADQPTHEQAEIEAGGVDQQSLPNVRVPAQVRAAQAAGLIEMSERALQSCTAQPQEALATRTADTPTVPIHGVACIGVLLPAPSPTIRFGDVTADADEDNQERVLRAAHDLLATRFGIRHTTIQIDRDPSCESATHPTT
jgi:hypothetical protein